MVNHNGEKAGTVSNKHNAKALSGVSIKKTALRGLVGCVIVLICAVMAVAGVMGYRYHNQHYQQLQRRITQQDADIARLTHKLKQSQQSVNAWRVPFEQLSHTVQNDQQGWQEPLQTLTKSVQSNHQLLTLLKQSKTNTWRVTEAAHYLQLATQRLLITGDVDRVILFLKQADQAILALEDPALIPVRRNIQHVITQLDSVQPVDKDGLFLKLDALSEQSMQLPTQLAVLSIPSVSTPKASTSDLHETWRQHLSGLAAQMWAGFTGLYRINTNRDVSVKALATPMQATSIRLNLHLLIEQAKWAVLRESPTLYRQSMGHAIHWLKEFFPENAEAVQNMMRDLTQLSTQTVYSKLPNVAPLLAQMRHALMEYGKAMALPAAPSKDTGESAKPSQDTGEPAKAVTHSQEAKL